MSGVSLFLRMGTAGADAQGGLRPDPLQFTLFSYFSCCKIRGKTV